MLKILYVLATALETGIGIRIFGQTFEKRTGMGKKQIASEIILYLVLILGIYGFSSFYYGVNRWNGYLPTLIIFSVILLGGWISYKVMKGTLKQRESHIIVSGLFMSMILLISCQYWTCYQSYLFTILGNIVPVLFLFCFYECSFIQAYLWEFWYCTNLALLKMIYVTYVGTFHNRSFEDFFLSPRIHTYSEVVYLLIICLVTLVFLRYMSVQYVLKEILVDIKKRFYIITLGEWLILCELMGKEGEKIDRENLTITLILVIGIVIILILVLAKTMKNIADNEREFLNSRNRILEQQYLELNTAYERYRCLIHDEKHMIFYLKECLDNGDNYTAQKFLESCQSNMMDGGSGFHTGIPTLDFILNVKKRQMDLLKAKFTFELAAERIIMEDADFVMMIGNLLDNAIEAIEKCPEENRTIHLILKNLNEMFFLQIKNSSAELPVTRNARFFTGKKRQEEHGWGIESVKHIVEKYDGQLSFEYDASFFEVSIIINERMNDGNCI